MSLTTASRQPLPKQIRDELRMTCALRGYSSIRSGEGKTLKQQHDLMFQFYHGVTNKSPSQIHMLCQGVSPYCDLYETTTHRAVTSKSTGTRKKSPTTKMFLKESLSRDDSRMFYTGTDICNHDLEKKNRNGSNTIINGRQLTDMAKRGLRDYRKALSFTADKWDLKRRQPIESGTSIDDVIEYVRCKMYLSTAKAITIDGDDESDKQDMIEWNLMKKLLDDGEPNAMVTETGKHTDKVKSKVKTKGEVKAKAKTGDDVDSSEDDEKSASDTDNNKINDDDDDCGNDEDKGKDEDAKVVKKKSAGEDKDNEDCDEFVPDDYIFNSYFAFCLWGPFATQEKQLTLFLLGKYYLLLIIQYINHY
jgi:hypothetical protein